MSRTLTQLLDAPRRNRAGGRGGKTTAMLTLAEELSKAGRRVIVTTTTHIFPPDAGRYGPVFSPEDTAGIAAALERTGLAVAAGPLDERGKLTGVSDAQVEGLLELAGMYWSRRTVPAACPAKHPVTGSLPCPPKPGWWWVCWG